jgi:cytidyltransferase-like protein
MKVREVFVTGGFDDLRSRHVRLLQEASRLGNVHVLIWSDNVIRFLEGKAPRFPEAERMYLLQAIRYVSGITMVKELFEPDTLPPVGNFPQVVWVVEESSANARKRRYCESHGIDLRVLNADALKGFPMPEPYSQAGSSSRKKVIVTGCYDWFHSGHVRFFEEVSTLGDLYAVVGHDANIRLLKGEGHPMIPQEVRRYMVQAVRYVRQALISTGEGWMDAAPQIAQIKPDIYAVNEDGDRPEKRAFCQANGLQYIVLKRIPKEGLPPRQGTDLRGY